MARGDRLGHINCPYCGYVNGMRITEDKSGNPFGYCEANCSGQLAVKGDGYRKQKFYELYPHLRKPGDAPPVVAAAAVPVASSGEGATESEVRKTPQTPPAKPARKAFSLGAA